MAAQKLVIPSLRKSETYRRWKRKRHLKEFCSQLASSGACENLAHIFWEEFEGLAEPEPVRREALATFFDNIRPIVMHTPGLVPVAKILMNPEQVLTLDIRWTNTYGEEMRNTAYRVCHSLALGPPRGPIRFSPDITLDLVKALAFQVTLQNSLMNMPYGGCFTGCDFDSRNASPEDLASFAQAFCVELRRNMDFDWPLDITAEQGCGQRECTALALACQNIINKRTGRPYEMVVGRPFATGLGAIEFAKRMLKLPSFDKTRCMVSGCGDAALGVARNLLAEGALVVSVSDHSGYFSCPEGLSYVQLTRIFDHKAERTSLKEISEIDGWLKNVKWIAGSLWNAYQHEADYAFACACEMEIGRPEAKNLIETCKIKAVIEVSYLSCSSDAYNLFDDADVEVAPSRAVNCGGMLAVTQNLSMDLGEHQFEHQMKTYSQFVHDQVRAVYDEFFPDVYFRDAADICALIRLTKGIRARGDLGALNSTYSSGGGAIYGGNSSGYVDPDDASSRRALPHTFGLGAR